MLINRTLLYTIITAIILTSGTPSLLFAQTDIQQQLLKKQQELVALQQELQKQKQQQESQNMIHVNGTSDDPCVNTGNYLTTFNCGRVDGNGTRHFTLIAQENVLFNITDQGQQFLGWAYNASIPGPTMRMTEGDTVQVTVINNGSNKLPHSLHMHSIHPGEMDGITGAGGAILPGHSFTYSFTAAPAGVYPYHCHVNPISDHINRGLFGAMIIDPKEGREKMPELVMVMNGYDLNYEQEGQTTLPDVNKTNPLKFMPAGNQAERSNEIYTVNGFAFGYMKHPIHLDLGETYRIYLVNMLEFDLVNSFHVHGMMFKYFPSGTVDSSPITTDIVTLGEGDRGIIEMTATQPGSFMFHAHQDEFASLGWMSMFHVA